MDTATLLWIIVGAVVVLGVLGVIIYLAAKRGRVEREHQRSEDQRRAEEMRKDAETRAIDARENEAKATRAQADAQQAQVDADRLRQEADQRQADAQDLRADSENQHRQADELDPTVNTRRGGRHSSGTAETRPDPAGSPAVAPENRPADRTSRRENDDST